MQRDAFIGGDCFVDVETASVVDLPACGSDVYFEHPDTMVLCLVITTEQGEEITWTLGERVPPRIFELVLLGWRFVAHGETFERLAFERILVPRHGFPMPEHWGCSMMKARYNGVPAALEHAASSLGLPVEKDMQGAGLMRRMCRPRGWVGQVPRWWHVEEPGLLPRLVSYCNTDTKVSQAVWRFTRSPTPADTENYELVMRMNKRGVGVDIEFARAAVLMARASMERLNRDLRIITRGRVDKATKVAQLKKWMAECGVTLDSLDKRELVVFLEREGAEIPTAVRQALALRMEANKTSVSKYSGMDNRASKDHRVRGVHVWHGASTGRLSSQGLQTQNFRRKIHKQAQAIIDYIRGNTDEVLLALLWGDPLELLSTLLRPTICATHGRMLVGGDLSQIEARVTAWLAGADAILALFASGADLYRHTAKDLFGCEPEAATDTQRQCGKVTDLALGFGGGAGALHSMGAIYGVKFTDEEAIALVRAWRQSHPEHRKMWKAFEDAALAAVMNPGKSWRVAGPADLDYGYDGTHLYCRLPSGRLLTYRDIELTRQELPWPGPDGEKLYAPLLLASGVNSVTRRYERYELTRIVLVENAVQAIAADVMFVGLKAADEADFCPVLSVHDELVCEPEPQLLPACQQQLGMLMTQPIAWAKGLPLAVKTWSAPRYMKE